MHAPARMEPPALLFPAESCSSVATLNQPDEAGTAADPYLSLTTLNVLAPIYKRIDSDGTRESEFADRFMARNQRILDLLLSRGSSVICLQVCDAWAFA